MSEFGSGIVVCLAKFSEHLNHQGPYNEAMIHDYYRWVNLPEEEKDKIKADAKFHPDGDSSAYLSNIATAQILKSIYLTDEQVISHMIELWMNSASDHFYDLDEKAPKPLRQLASLTLKIGHGFTQEVWTMDTITEIRKLWKESCLAVDKMLGVETDWGKW